MAVSGHGVEHCWVGAPAWTLRGLGMKTRAEEEKGAKMTVFCRSRALGVVVLAVFGVNSMMMAGPADAEESRPSAVQETYDDWVVHCQTLTGDAGARTMCQMSQELRQKGTDKRVLLVAFDRDAKGNGAKATIIAPFGILLQQGLAIEVAKSELARGGFRTCLPVGCVVDLAINGDDIRRLAEGDKATVVMGADNGQPMRVDISLKGFTAAWNRLLALDRV